METRQVDRLQNTSTLQHDNYQYALMAKANKEVEDKVMAVSRDFLGTYGKTGKTEPDPKITIATFSIKPEMEDTMLRYMQRICSQQNNFNVELNNYSGIPPHTIYLRVQNHQPFRHLSQQLSAINDYLHSCDCLPLKMVMPHINVAAKLTGDVYLKALMDYGQQTFHEVFTVNEIVLYKRKHEYDQYKMVHVFSLQPVKKTLYN